MMSTGLPWLQVGGRTASSAAIVSGASSASLPPADERVGREDPGPPALLRTVRRGRGAGAACRGPRRNRRGRGRSAQDPSARNAASRTSSLPVSDRYGTPPPPPRRSARLHDDDRLRARDLARRGEEGARVADGLHVQDDRVGLGVVAEMVDEVAPADVGHRAERDDAAEADALAQAPVEDRGDERAALADERHRGPGRPASSRRRVQAGDGLITPRQLGPMSRMPWARAWSMSARSSAAPSRTDLLKPAEMTMTLPMRRPHSATRSRRIVAAASR